jgi:Spy/CpxP family protein refolding chaperone
MRRTLLITMLALGLAATAVQAQPRFRMGGHMGGPMGGGPGMGPDPGMLFPMILGKLDLSTEQHAQVRTILESHRPTMQALFPQLRTAHENLAAKLFQADPLSAQDLTPYVDAVNKAKAQVVQEGIKIALDIRGVLTPAQLAKASEIHTQLESLHAQMKALLGEPDAVPVP